MENETFRPFQKVPQKPDAPKRIDNGEMEMPSNVPPIIAKAMKQNQVKESADAFNEPQINYNINPDAMPKGKPLPFNLGPKTADPVDSKLAAFLAKASEKTTIYTELQLPSLGKFYDSSIAPTNGVVHVRQMTGKEEQVLNSPKLYKKSQAINQVLVNCTKETIKPELMLSEDRSTLLVYIRGISLGPNYQVEVKCPSCTEEFPFNINLDREIKACPDDISPDSLIKILPQTGFKVYYRLQNGDDDVQITEYQERRSKNTKVDDTFQFKASLLINFLEDVDSGERIEDKVSIKKLIENLPMLDVDYMRGFLNEQLFGIDNEIPIECSSCNHEFKIGMPMELNFFFPSLDKKKKKY